MTYLYFFLVRKVVSSEYCKGWWFLYRRYTGLLEARKHFVRRNYKLSFSWLLWAFKL